GIRDFHVTGVQTCALPIYSVFSRSGHRIDVVAASLIDTTKAIAIVSFPIAAVLMLAAPAVQADLFGSRWAGLAPVLTLLALGQTIGRASCRERAFNAAVAA